MFAQPFLVLSLASLCLWTDLSWYSITILLLVFGFIQQKLGQASLPVLVNGHVEPKFEEVKHLFRQYFIDGRACEGASVAVYHRGKLVVDLWGGYADSDALRPFQRDTLVNLFSIHKSVTALVIAKLVDQGKLSYDDLVCKHWPEFGQHGKDVITVRQLMSHLAGIAHLDEWITFEDAQDSERMARILERQTLNWEPGTEMGYHNYTFGWCAAQLLKRVDPKHRNLNDFVNEEIDANLINERYIGALPLREEARVARLLEVPIAKIICTNLRLMTSGSRMKKHLYNAFGALVYRIITRTPAPIFNNPTFLNPSCGRNGFNNPDVHRIDIPQQALCTARGMGSPFNELVMGRVLSSQTIRTLKTPLYEKQRCQVVRSTSNGGHGFTHTKRPNSDQWIIGQSAWGGQNLKIDFDNQLVFVYVTNGLRVIELEPSNRLLRQVYECLDGK